MNLKNKIFLGVISTTLVAGATQWEGTKYVPYYDMAGILTVCQGYTGKDIIKTKQYSPTECKQILSQALAKHQAGILQCINVPLTQYQLDAFTLFAYNVGVGAFCSSSTVLKPLNQGNYSVACDGLMKWVFVNGKEVQGLKNRREYERKMCKGEFNIEKVHASVGFDSSNYGWTLRNS